MDADERRKSGDRTLLATARPGRRGPACHTFFAPCPLDGAITNPQKNRPRHNKNRGTRAGIRPIHGGDKSMALARKPQLRSPAARYRRHALKTLLCAALAALGLAAGPAQADDWPSKPIKIIVPYTPGGSTDIVTRIVMEKLGPRLGVPIVIENKPGASGTIGSSTAARAAPDGYTLILTSSSTHSATPALFRKLPYDPTGDFIHVIRIATIPMMLVVRADSPYGSVSQLVQATRARLEAHGIRIAPPQLS